MNPDSKLEDAIILASLYYKDSIDCDGQPCIMHLLRVMLDVPKEPEYQIAALLHELPVDFDYSLDDIRGTFGDKVADAVEVLNDFSAEEAYRTYIKKVMKNDIARIVKIADLKDEIKTLSKLSSSESNIAQTCLRLTMKKVYENALQILGG
jgi:guanosine-3',5'-bis(diphosphate) 3'-pyrophosphohydrolase